MTPIATEVASLLVQVGDDHRDYHRYYWHWRSHQDKLKVEDNLVNAAALHLAIYFGLKGAFRALLPRAAAVLSFAAGPRCIKQTPIHLATYCGWVQTLMR